MHARAHTVTGAHFCTHACLLAILPAAATCCYRLPHVLPLLALRKPGPRSLGCWTAHTVTRARCVCVCVCVCERVCVRVSVCVCVCARARARYPSAMPAIPCFPGACVRPGASITRTSRVPLHFTDCCVPAAAPTAAACCCRSPCANKNSGVARRHPGEGGGVCKPSLARVLLSSEHEVASFHAGHQKSLLVAT